MPLAGRTAPVSEGKHEYGAQYGKDEDSEHHARDAILEQNQEHHDGDSRNDRQYLALSPRRKFFLNSLLFAFAPSRFVLTPPT